MKGWLGLLLGGLVGGGAGFVVGAKIVQKKLNTKHEEEIESVKQAFKQYYCTKEETSTAVIDRKDLHDKPVLVQKSSIDEKPETNNTVNYGQRYIEPEVAVNIIKDEEIHERLRDKSKPYVITEEEYYSSNYKTKTLWYTDDGIISDELGNVLSDDDIDILVGDALVHFNRNTNETLYVRNDEDKTDYEIAYNEMNYTAAYSTDTYIVGEKGIKDGKNEE